MTQRLAALLEEIKRTHASSAALAAFCPFADDLIDIPLAPRNLPCAEYMYQNAAFRDAEHPLARAFYNAGPDAHWRETYRNTDIGTDFMDRFGCYCAVGEGGAWKSAKMASYVVTMPPKLHYPWHHHPAEEMYLVLAGEATFLRDGEAAEQLGVGDSSFHASNQPHAMTTGDAPVMAYVVWRNNLGIKPVLTPDHMLRDAQ
jgi:quercetin dioxygenase-like cupin family protein